MNLRLRTILVTLLATCLYLGLAILGRGGFAAFFAEPALTAIVVVTFALALAGLLSSGNLSSGEKEDRGNRWVFIAFTAVGLASAYFPALTDRLDVWTFGGDAVRWIGVALYVVGGVVRIWPVFVLGRRFSGLVAIQPGHELVTTGVYGAIRNPSYLGLLVNVLGWALAFRSTIGVVLAALYIPPLIARIRSEEKLLRSHFGAPYDAYCARTSRLIPGVY